MKRIYHILLLLSCALVIGMKANAQRVFFVEPKEDPSITAGPNQVKIIIHSNSDKLAMTHNMGEEKGVRTTNDDGTYCYTINYSFPEDYEDDFDDEDPWVTENIAKAMEHKPAKKQSARQKKPARRTEPEREKKPSKGVRALDETGPAIRKPVKKINLEDTNDFEAFTPLDEEAFDNFEGYYSEDDDYDLFGAGYDDDDLFDATADLLSNHPEKRRSHAEMDDTFKMDVIDLD